MAKPTPKDNSTAAQKLALRRQALTMMRAEPVVMETHGGAGHLWRQCYSHIPQGVVFEQQAAKAAVLAHQRPTWTVFEGDCVGALEAGAGRHLAVNFLDVDPYGEPWPTLEAFFTSERPRPAELQVVVNDGLRQKIRIGGGWQVGSMAELVERYGNDLRPRYLECCEELLTQLSARAGYTLALFTGYYCGEKQDMTHYWATLIQR
jgi:hypothetical protein